MMIKYARILEAVMETPWAILPSKLAIIRDLLAYRAAGHLLSDEEIKERLQPEAAHRGRRLAAGGHVAVLPLVGTIIPRGNILSESSGAVSAQRFAGAFREAVANDDVGHIVLDVDSPGGQVGGIEELAREIFEARGTKPITAVANHTAASAAYWVASAADELVVSPSSEVGSIGVFAMHQDISQFMENEGVKTTLISAGEFKTEGNPFEPLGEVALGAIQGRVDDYYNLFINAVARHRNVAPQAVREGFGRGRVVGAEEAIQAGMADRVATIDQVINGIAAQSPARMRADKEFRQRRLRAASR